MPGTGLPLVVLLHGTRDDAASFDEVAAHLGAVDVLAYDRRGWGDAPATEDNPATLADHAEDLLAAIGRRRATVVGHSFGGHVAITAALRRPDLVASVGLWETTMPWAPWWQGEHDRLIRGARDSVAGKPPGTPRQNRDRRGFVAEATESLAQQYELSEFATPCIVGYGTASVPSFRLGMHALAEQLGAEVFELPDATHMAHREHSEEFARFVKRAVALGAPAGDRTPN